MITVANETERIQRTIVETPLGRFAAVTSVAGLRALAPIAGGAAEASEAQDEHAATAGEALRAYAAGDTTPYAGALDLRGSDFQLRVWRRLLAIPFGAQVTYGALAPGLGIPGEARAVGAAVAANPVAILVPCHRVVGAGGTLRGYAWGLDLKRRLLAHELRIG